MNTYTAPEATNEIDPSSLAGNLLSGVVNHEILHELTRAVAEEVGTAIDVPERERSKIDASGTLRQAQAAWTLLNAVAWSVDEKVLEDALTDSQELWQTRLAAMWSAPDNSWGKYPIDEQINDPRYATNWLKFSLLKETLDDYDNPDMRRSDRWHGVFDHANSAVKAFQLIGRVVESSGGQIEIPMPGNITGQRLQQELTFLGGLIQGREQQAGLNQAARDQIIEQVAEGLEAQEDAAVTGNFEQMREVYSSEEAAVLFYESVGVRDKRDSKFNAPFHEIHHPIRQPIRTMIRIGDAHFAILGARPTGLEDDRTEHYELAQVIPEADIVDGSRVVRLGAIKTDLDIERWNREEMLQVVAGDRDIYGYSSWARGLKKPPIRNSRSVRQSLFGEYFTRGTEPRCLGRLIDTRFYGPIPESSTSTIMGGANSVRNIEYLPEDQLGVIVIEQNGDFAVTTSQQLELEGDDDGAEVQNVEILVNK